SARCLTQHRGGCGGGGDARGTISPLPRGVPDRASDRSLPLLERSPCAQPHTPREFADSESRDSTPDAAAVSAGALSVAESSRDVSDPTSGPRTSPQRRFGG